MLRDESNELMDEAQALLKEALQLPDVEELQAEQADQKAGMFHYSVSLSRLDNRLDASYHVPIVQAIERRLEESAKEVVKVGDSRISQSVILPGRFKRVYVEEGSGIVFFGGKQIYELDPSNRKYLSISQHEDRILNNLKIHTNSTLITRSGTIGKLQLCQNIGIIGFQMNILSALRRQTTTSPVISMLGFQATMPIIF